MEELEINIKNRHISKMVEICRMYYEEELTQAEIAKNLGISRPAISKILSDAKKQGIVRIEVVSPIVSDDSIMEEFCNQFGINTGLIISTNAKEADFLQGIIISQAAVYIDNLVVDMKKIGLGWGETIGYLIDRLSSNSTKFYNERKVCPIIGSAPFPIKSMQANELSRLFSEKIGFIPQYLHAPAFPNTQSDKKLFENTSEFKHTLNLWEELDTVILAIDAHPSIPDQATAARFGGLLCEEKSVGVIDTYFYDKSGKFIESNNDLVIRMPLELISKTKRVIAIAYGVEKAVALRGALLTGLITDLIVDEMTARKTLEYHKAMSEKCDIE